MSKEMTVIVLGVWIVVVPYLGIPGSWRTVILVLSGIGIAAVGFMLRAEALSRGGSRARHRPFVENFDMPPPTMHEQKEGISSLR
jgi:hypothetical protein